MVTTAAPNIAMEMRGIANRQCIPLFVTFEITKRCNIRCEHCYNFDRSIVHTPGSFSDELSSAEIMKIIDEVRAMGGLYLSFTGGEPLLHPDLPEFVAHARRNRMVAHVKSNGTMFDERMVKRLVEAGISAVKVSLYGATPETHDAFTHSHGSHRRTISGIRAAKESGIDIKVSFNLMKTNAHEIGEMVAFAKSLDISYGIDPFITSRYDGTDSSLDLSLDRETLSSLYRGILRELVPSPDFRPNLSIQCSCARSVCGITATGDVYPCISAPVVSGNLREQSFQEIWRHSPQFEQIRKLKNDDFKTCNSCNLRPYCRRNSGVIVTNTGNYTGPAKFGDDWTCMEAEVIRDIVSQPVKA